MAVTEVKQILRVHAIETKHAGLYKGILYGKLTMIVIFYLIKSNVETLLNIMEIPVLMIMIISSHKLAF